MVPVIVLIISSLCACAWGYTVQDAPLLLKRPIWLKACKKSDPKINECINEMFLLMFPYLATGIPEINVERFEPLSLESVSISKGNGPILLAGSLYDLHVIGPSKSAPRDTQFTQNGQNGHWHFGLDLPLLDIRSKYNLKGQILVLPLLGHGNCELKLYNISTQVHTNITFPQKEGREIMQIDSMKVGFKVGDIRVKLDNLFNGNKILGHTVNAFINQNGLEIVSELEESIGQSLADIFTKLMNNVFVKIPTDLWYLSDEQYAEYEEELKNSQRS